MPHSPSDWSTRFAVMMPSTTRTIQTDLVAGAGPNGNGVRPERIQGEYVNISGNDRSTPALGNLTRPRR